MEQLLCEEVDPGAFLAEAGQLAEAAEAQQAQLEGLLRQLLDQQREQGGQQQQEQQQDGGGSVEDAVRRVQTLLRQRAEGAALLQEALAVAREVTAVRI